MKTVIETPTFQKQADQLWTESERLDFISWISINPLAGDVIPGADGARVIYFNLTERGIIYLITLYAKSSQATINPKQIPKGEL